jgi:hypothetical protein
MMTDKQMGRPVQADIASLSPQFLADPFAVWRALPPETPVFYAPSIDYYLVTRYADTGRRPAISFHSNTSFRGPQELWVQHKKTATPQRVA